MSEDALPVSAMPSVLNDVCSPCNVQSPIAGTGSHLPFAAPLDEKLFPSATSDAGTAPPLASTVASLDREEAAHHVAHHTRRRKIAWKCGMCGYHVLAMDHEGRPLPFSVSSFGELLPMGCPRCQLHHTQWEQAVPFNVHGDHTNIRSRLTNNYAPAAGGAEAEADETAPQPQSQPQPTQPPPGRVIVGEGGPALPEVLQQIGRCTYKDGVPIPTVPKAPRKRGDRMAYYCGHCGRQLLRMDPYGELVPMVRDKDGTPLPIVCPGCKVEHNQWEVKPYTIVHKVQMRRMNDHGILAFFPGAAHGTTTVVLGHPIDTAKTRMQAMGPRSSGSLLTTMCGMAREEGVRSLYRGATPPLLMSATKRSFQFAAWDVFRRPGAGKTFPTFFSKSWEWVSASAFRAGAIAGGIGTFIGCPIHVIKIRTQFSTRATTKNAWTCTKDIYRAEGVLGYYRGFRYHLLKDTLFASCYLGTYESIQRRLNDFPRGGAVQKSAQSGSHITFTAGCVASLVTWALLYPLDTVKTIVQARNLDIRKVMDMFWHDKCVMYRGLGAALIRSGPVSGAAMVSYEFVKNCVEKRRECERSENYMRST